MPCSAIFIPRYVCNAPAFFHYFMFLLIRKIPSNCCCRDIGFFTAKILFHKYSQYIRNSMLKSVHIGKRSSSPEVFLVKGVLKICSKFTGEHPSRNVISIKLLCNFLEITLQHGYSPVNLLHIFRTPFPKNTPGRLLLQQYKPDKFYNISFGSC